MRHLAIVLGLAGLVLSGCGKSADERHLESELWMKVKALHDTTMAQVMEFGDLEQKIDEAVARHEDLAKRYGRKLKGHSADDLVAARATLESLKTKMENWMKGFKPYDESLSHQDAMASLEVSLRWLTGMQGELERGMQQADDALQAHEQAALSVMNKGG